MDAGVISELDLSLQHAEPSERGRQETVYQCIRISIFGRLAYRLNITQLSDAGQNCSNWAGSGDPKFPSHAG